LNIPFYRCVKYLEDGHYLYQCLHCGAEIDVGAWRWSPRFCCYCGIEYKGAMLDKRTDYISIPKTQKLFYQIESAINWEDGQELQWSPNWRGSHNPYEVIQYLKDERAFKEKESKSKKTNKWEFRIRVIKKDKYHGCLIIDTDKYYRKTGKKFNRNKYQKVE